MSHLCVSYLYIQSSALWVLPPRVSLLRTFLGHGMRLGWNTLLQVKNWQVWFGGSSNLDVSRCKTKWMGGLRWRESKKVEKKAKSLTWKHHGSLAVNGRSKWKVLWRKCFAFKSHSLEFSWIQHKHDSNVLFFYLASWSDEGIKRYESKRPKHKRSKSKLDIFMKIMTHPLLSSHQAGHQMISTAGLWRRVGTMWNVPAPTCLSTQPTPSLPLLHPTMRPSMPRDLSASQV